MAINLLLPLLLFTHWHTGSPSEVLSDDPEFMAELAESGLEVMDFSKIGRHDLNRQIKLHDPQGICCSSNYSALWDDDGELIVLSVDSFFCPDTIQEIRDQDALHPGRTWETLQMALNRAYQNGARLGKEYYDGNYPGVTSNLIFYKTLMAMRRCLSPFAKIMLDSEQFILRQQVLNKNLTDRATFFPDVNHEKPSSLPPTFTYTDVEEGNDDEEEELTYYDDPEGGVPLHGVPIIPMFISSFFASAAFPPQNLSEGHSQPHTDGWDAGLASVFTLTDDPKFESCGTTFNIYPGRGLSILHNDQQIRSVGMDQHLKQDAALEMGLPENSGWLNTSSNRFSNILVLARNKYNRFIMYPSNRLHTAFIPGEEFLSTDPKVGRLTINTFWDVYTNIRDVCENSIKNALFENHIHRSTKWPETPQEYLRACRICKSWQTHCKWCPIKHLCLGEGQEVAGTCDDVPMNDTSTGMLGLETSCEESAALMEKCMYKDSCETCSGTPGCAWCLNAGICRLEGQGVCQNTLAHVGAFGKGKCPGIPSVKSCNVYEKCHTCRDAGCSWCNRGVLDPSTMKVNPRMACVADLEFMCMTRDESSVVGTFGKDTCDKEVAKDSALQGTREQMWGRLSAENADDNDAVLLELPDSGASWGGIGWETASTERTGAASQQLLDTAAILETSAERKSIMDVFFMLDE